VPIGIIFNIAARILLGVNRVLCGMLNVLRTFLSACPEQLNKMQAMNNIDIMVNVFFIMKYDVST
jgi:hypothetical protein